MHLSPWPCFDEEAIQIVAEVLRSGRVNQWTGDHVSRFEVEYARYVGCPHAVAVANGTVALELALEALDIGAGDEVIVPCRTFVATATAVIMRGAVPVFADVDADSQTLTVETAALALSPRTKAVIAVHLAGWPCPLHDLRTFCDSHGLRLIEDCAQAHGARIHDAPVGSIGDASAFSFCQDKIISTGGEGGMLIAQTQDTAERAWSFKDHGRDYDMALSESDFSAGYRWLTTRVGTNWRMTEMQAALGRHYLAKLDDSVGARRRHADRLRQEFQDCRVLRLPPVPPHVYHSYYRFYTFVRPHALRTGWNRNRLWNELNRHGLDVGTGACPEVYREPIFAHVRYPDGITRDLRPAAPLPVARDLGETTLMFQVHPNLTEHEIDSIADITLKILRAARR